MVKTRSATKKIDAGKGNNDNGGATGDVTIKSRPVNRSSVKRRGQEGSKTAAAPQKRRRGKPSEICQLNLDVLFLIAAYIHPLDLLNLARTCKSLRQLLMDKSSAFVWKAARRQVDKLPDCPVDLTEPEYANLVFYARCHSCGKFAKNVLWKMRRRYCVDCRVERLCTLSSCHEVIRKNNTLPTENIAIEGETMIWVDRDQMESFMRQYERSSDKVEFLDKKKRQYGAISMHAHKCEAWQRDKAWGRKIELNASRRERDQSVLKRLKQLGYEREVEYFTPPIIRKACKSLFGKSKPLTDKEWNRIWPAELETMNNFRSRRLEEVVYQPRRCSLASEYTNYIAHPPPSASALGIFPHAADIACFPCFRDIIKAPEGPRMSANPFESVFAQLPELVEKWRKELDTEVAALVKIPSHLTMKDTSEGQAVPSNGKTGSESSKSSPDKLRLACALFYGMYRGLFTHPEVFSSSMRFHVYPQIGERDLGRNGSIRDRYNIEYVAEAPYVIHACGMDPSVATAEDMDRLDPYLKCQSCQTSCVRRWRDAVWHALYHHRSLGANPETPEPVRWQVISDKSVATGLSFKEELEPNIPRCLLCLSHVGDAMSPGGFEIRRHLREKHNLNNADIQEGVHFAYMGLTPRGAFYCM